MAPVSRRFFLQGTALAAALPLVPGGAAQAAPASLPPPSPLGLHWLDGATPALSTGTTVGVPWPRGQVPKDTAFALKSGDGKPLAVQSWPLAWWPDGSLKWSAHALAAGAPLSKTLSLAPGAAPAAPATPLRVTEGADTFTIDTGVVAFTVPRRGAEIIASMRRGGVEIGRAGKLVLLVDDQPDASAGSVRQASFVSDISKVTLEQSGPVRAVLKLDGMHRNAQRAWLPFSVRLYFYAGAESLRIMHSFVFDGDEQKDFIHGLGLRFEVPLRDLPHDRHVRFGGESGGLWAEGVRNLTGLRRDPGAAVRAAQLAGLACPPLDQFAEPVRRNLEFVPVWGDYTLAQLSADGYGIRKRTKAGFGWVEAAWGHRAPGVGYIGGTKGGIAFGLRDFWQRHPVQLDIRNAHTDSAEVTLWMVAPDAPAMDMRFYHDGMGMQTHEQELRGLEITYEDYEKGFGSPVGVARSSELTLWVLAATPSRERMVQIADAVQTPPLLVAPPAHYLASGVFGALWSLPDRAHPVKAAIEDQLDARFDFYRKQVEQRHWYGFWDYGDVRHSYDADRHEWKYDVGGFAWDNSELSPDLWLWYSFLRTGRADIFRFAEAMVRHTSEVDIYHLGQFAGLGTRHGVQHWGDSAKQARISTAAYRRFYYYLTADERIGDIMHALIDVDKKLDSVDPVRKIAKAPPKGQYSARVSFGTDWGSLTANWLTEWERGGSPVYRDKILAGMKDIAALPNGFFSANRMGYEQDSGRMHNLDGDKIAASHLNAVFGAVEVFAELIALTGDSAFEKAWLDYCALYNADEAEQQRVLGKKHGGGRALTVGHSRLTAYAAFKRKDARLARRAWDEFASDGALTTRLKTVRISGPAVLNPIDEIATISTNDTAQWGLAAIQNLALIGEYLR
ncbi:MAG: Tat pathway signal sequence domain protein [Massilia sp.]